MAIFLMPNQALKYLMISEKNQPRSRTALIKDRQHEKIVAKYLEPSNHLPLLNEGCSVVESYARVHP